MIVATLVIESVPDALYARLKRMAEASNRSMGQEAVHVLETALTVDLHPQPSAGRPSYWARRELLPEYEALLRSGKLKGGTDSTVAISEERDAR